MTAIASDKLGGVRRWARRGEARGAGLAWLLLAPALILIAGVVALPVGYVGYLALTEQNLLSDSGGQFVGLRNFARALSSGAFYSAAWTTMVYATSTVVASFGAGLGCAHLLERVTGRWRWVRSLFIAPWVTSAVVVAFLFLYMFDNQVGVINAFLVRFGLVEGYLSWLSDSTLAMVAVVLATVWQQTPFFTLMFIAAMKGIPQDVKDASQVDGATGWENFRHITVPFLSKVMIISATLVSIRSLNNFPIIWTMTRGGPVDATTTTVVQVYRIAFESFQLGYSAAIGALWMVFILIASSLYARAILKDPS
ncbi:sugar ABC transporter permease [soil metagenome]